MLNLDEIEQEIADLENGETTYINLQKLTYLYTVRDHYVCSTDGTDFLKAIAGKDRNKIFSIMDDLMTELSSVKPTIYNRVMQKIRGA